MLRQPAGGAETRSLEPCVGNPAAAHSHGPGGGDPRRDDLARLGAAWPDQLGLGHRRHLDPQVDPVAERTRHPAGIAIRDANRTATAGIGSRPAAARARVHCGDQLEPRGEGHGAADPDDRYPAVLERLAKRLERARGTLTARRGRARRRRPGHLSSAGAGAPVCGILMIAMEPGGAYGPARQAGHRRPRTRSRRRRAPRHRRAAGGAAGSFERGGSCRNPADRSAGSRDRRPGRSRAHAGQRPGLERQPGPARRFALHRAGSHPRSLGPTGRVPPARPWSASGRASWRDPPCRRISRTAARHPRDAPRSRRPGAPRLRPQSVRRPGPRRRTRRRPSAGCPGPCAGRRQRQLAMNAQRPVARTCSEPSRIPTTSPDQRGSGFPGRRGGLTVILRGRREADRWIARGHLAGPPGPASGSRRSDPGSQERRRPRPDPAIDPLERRGRDGSQPPTLSTDPHPRLIPGAGAWGATVRRMRGPRRDGWWPWRAGRGGCGRRRLQRLVEPGEVGRRRVAIALVNMNGSRCSGRWCAAVLIDDLVVDQPLQRALGVRTLIGEGIQAIEHEPDLVLLDAGCDVSRTSRTFFRHDRSAVITTKNVSAASRILRLTSSSRLSMSMIT